MSRMTSSFNPGGTTSASMSVTKPYLYGWRTWASMPLLIESPEVLCVSEVAMKLPWRNRILRELLGIVKYRCPVSGVRGFHTDNQTPETGQLSVDIPIHLSHQPLVDLRRVQIVDHSRIVYGHRGELRLVRQQHRPRPVAGGRRALGQLGEEGPVPEYRMAAPLGEGRDHGRGGREAVALEETFDRADPDVREVHRPRQDGGGADRLERGERGSERANLARADIGLLDDHALVGGQGRPDAGGVGAEHDQAGFHVERFQSFEDPDHEGHPPEVQQRLGPTHPLGGPRRE